MTPIDFPAGVTNLASKAAKTVNWRDSNLIRWENGVTLRPILGWEKYSLAPFASKLRKMHKWSANNGILYTAYLCERHCYVEIDGILTDITPVGGLSQPVGNIAGYSDDLYNRYKYNTPRPGEARLKLYTPIFSLDNWGEDLRVMSSADGRLLGWSPTSAPGTLLTAIPNAPVGNRSFIITSERHIMLFGSTSFDRFAWCDEENDQNWAFADILSRAGFYEVQPKSPIVAHEQSDFGIIMFSLAMAYHIQYVGLPYIYSYRPIGKISVPLSPASICTTPDGVIWPSIDGWWIFDGTVPRILKCDVWDFISDNIDIPQARFDAVCVHFMNHGEVWWFWPDKRVPGKNYRYTMYDYRSKTWANGLLNRNCGFVYANDRYPMLSDGTNVWKHEIGTVYPEAVELPWIESFNLAPDGGENWITINKILPEIVGDISAIKVSMLKTNDRSNHTPEIRTPLRSINTNGSGRGWADIRETARDMRLRIDMVKESNWGTLGPILFDIKMRGKK
jgi:hypothetical protein